jgi:hypothetical protein
MVSELGNQLENKRVNCCGIPKLELPELIATLVWNSF